MRQIPVGSELTLDLDGDLYENRSKMAVNYNSSKIRMPQFNQRLLKDGVIMGMDTLTGKKIYINFIIRDANRRGWTHDSF